MSSYKLVPVVRLEYESVQTRPCLQLPSVASRSVVEIPGLRRDLHPVSLRPRWPKISAVPLQRFEAEHASGAAMFPFFNDVKWDPDREDDEPGRTVKALDDRNPSEETLQQLRDAKKVFADLASTMAWEEGKTMLKKRSWLGVNVSGSSGDDSHFEQERDWDDVREQATTDDLKTNPSHHQDHGRVCRQHTQLQPRNATAFVRDFPGRDHDGS